MTSHLLLIDCSTFAYRAYHARTPRHRSDGLPVHAVLGVMSLLWSMMGRAEKDPYQYAAAVFDAPGKTFRHKLFKDYKGHRTRPVDLSRQLPIMREAAHVMGFEPVEAAGYEADDIIATLAHRAKLVAIRTTIVSIDKDFCQLVEDNVVEIADPVKRERVLEAQVRKKFGVEPRLVPDVQALCGDSVDNIPGAPGIGLKIAAGLIRRFGSLEALIRALDKPSEHFPTGVRSSLKRARADLKTYKKLATLKRDVDFPCSLAGLKPRRFDEDNVRDFLRLLEAEDIYENTFGGSARVMRVVPHVEDEHAWWRTELRRPGQKVPEVPQSGYYRRRLVMGGKWVPARIWREIELDFMTEEPTDNDRVFCEVNGQRKDPLDQWGYLCMHPISKADYDDMKTVENPTEKIDPSKVPLSALRPQKANT